MDNGVMGEVERAAAVITISDSASAGERVDTGGRVVAERLQAFGFQVLQRLVIPDDRVRIANTLRTLCDSHMVQLVVTTGGTGVGPRDVTPEATMDVVDRTLPGMAEAMRMDGLKQTPYAMISRQVVGVRGKTLIVNLPGSVKAVEQGLQTIQPVLAHVVDMLAGKTAHDE